MDKTARPDANQTVLFISPTDVNVNNGMLQRQIQFLEQLSSRYPNRLDILALASSPKNVREWLGAIKVNANVLGGAFACLARLNAWVWYVFNIILCNKLRLLDHFSFFISTPLSKARAKRYDLIICYYPWGHVLLGLGRFGSKVVVDLGDVMANRHHRIGNRKWISLSAACEYQILTSGSRCVAISYDDRNEFERLYGVTLPVVPFIPPSHGQLSSIGSPTATRSIGYFGARSYQNEEVMHAICSQSFLQPLARGGWKLVLAGGICASISQEEKTRVFEHGGRVLGRVDDLADFYGQVGVVLNPVGPSTGVKIKSVEALFARRRLVTTPFGADEWLRQDFGNQITTITWPLDLERLALEAMGDESESCNQAQDRGFNAYVQRTNQAFDALLTS